MSVAMNPGLGEPVFFPLGLNTPGSSMGFRIGSIGGDGFHVPSTSAETTVQNRLTAIGTNLPCCGSTEAPLLQPLEDPSRVDPQRLRQIGDLHLALAADELTRNRNEIFLRLRAGLAATVLVHRTVFLTYIAISKHDTSPGRIDNPTVHDVPLKALEGIHRSRNGEIRQA